jgi:hypothetical protein
MSATSAITIPRWTCIGIGTTTASTRGIHWYDGAWVVIDASPNYYYDTAPTVVLSSGVSSDLVAQVQSALDRRGYDAGPVDGIAGAQTRDAIATYQADNGLAATGNINDTLLQSLNL